MSLLFTVFDCLKSAVGPRFAAALLLLVCVGMGNPLLTSLAWADTPVLEPVPLMPINDIAISADNPPEGHLEPEGSPEFVAAVKAYRVGNYALAHRSFAALHKSHPDDLRNTYYLAISEAQLGHFKQARQLYQEILMLDPHGETAALAREGLRFLPAETSLDRPPRFQLGDMTVGEAAATPLSAASVADAKAAIAKQSAEAGGVPASAVGASGNVAAAPSAPGLSPQDLMMMQMMMGQSGGSGGAGGNNLNMLPFLMMPQANSADPSKPNAGPAIDPSVMSNMLMNQMMQNFSMTGSDKGD